MKVNSKGIPIVMLNARVPKSVRMRVTWMAEKMGKSETQVLIDLIRQEYTDPKPQPAPAAADQFPYVLNTSFSEVSSDRKKGYKKRGTNTPTTLFFTEVPFSLMSKLGVIAEMQNKTKTDALETLIRSRYEAYNS